MGVLPSRRRGRARTVLAAAWGAAVIAVSAAACGSGGNGTSGPAGAAGESGGTATFALPPATVPDYIFPFDNRAHFSAVNAQDFQYLMYRPLYWFGDGAPTLNTSLSLADEPVYRDSSVTITVKGWRWSNGETVTAQDVIFWIHMMQAVGSASWGAYVPGGFPSNVSSVKATGPATLTMTMNKRYSPAWFTDNELSQITPMPLAWDITSVGGKAGSGGCAISVTRCGKVYAFLDGQSKAISGWASSSIWSVVDGPWKLQSFNSDGGSVFVPNKAYSGSPKPRLARFQEIPFASESAEYDALQTGSAGDSQRIDVGYLPTTDAPANATTDSNPVSGYTLDPLYSSQGHLPQRFPAMRQPAGAYRLTEVAGNLRGAARQSAALGINPESWYFVRG